MFKLPLTCPYNIWEDPMQSKEKHPDSDHSNHRRYQLQHHQPQGLKVKGTPGSGRSTGVSPNLPREAERKGKQLCLPTNPHTTPAAKNLFLDT